MTKLLYQRKTYYIGQKDELAIDSIRERQGLSPASNAVRYALRELDRLEQETKQRRKTSA